MKNIWLNIILALIVSFLLISTNTIAQEKQNTKLLPGPKGVAIPTSILVIKDATNPKIPHINQTIIINRKLSGEKEFRKIASVSFPKNSKELFDKLEEKDTEELLKRLKATSQENAYEIITQNGLDTLGILLFSVRLQEALGLYYTDRTWQKGQVATYSLDREYNGSIKEGLYSETVDGNYIDYNIKFSLQSSFVNSSNSSSSWTASLPDINTWTPEFANLYAFDDIKNEFVFAGQSMVTIEDDKLSVYFGQDVDTDSQIMWYIRPTDRVGNIGVPSDTMYSIAIDRSQIQTIHGFKVTDTLEGLLLQWDPLPPIGYYTGIQVLKSRTLGKDYIVLDTIAPYQTQLIDRQVIPGSNYYYKIRPLLYELPDMEPLLFIDASGYIEVQEDIQPTTPQGLKAELSNKGVELSWIPNPELNIFGYYIYRGVSKKNMDMIAGPIKGYNYVDSAFIKNYSGQYVYAIQVMDNGQNMSDTSEVASVFIRQPIVLASPGGLQAKDMAEGIELRWENTRNHDHQVIGFIVFRKEKGAQSYEILNSQPIPYAQYVDSSTVRGIEYEYAVSSIDTWGNQSILSPFARVSMDVDEFLKPPSSISLRNVRDGIEISWSKPYQSQNRQYIIYRSPANQERFVKISSTDPNQFFVDKSVKDNLLYQYKVAVKIDQIEGEKSSAFMIRRQ